MKIKSSIITLTHEPHDAKIANLIFDGSDIIIESIPDYLLRVKFGIRVPGVIVSIIEHKTTPGTVTFPITTLDTVLRDYTNKYYAFLGGIRDEDFKEIVFSGEAGDSAYQVAVNNGYVGDETSWLLSLIGPTGDPGSEGDSAYQIAVNNGFVGTEQEWLDSLVGADGEQGLPGTPNDEYTVLVTQTGTNDPVLDVKENNIGTITCTRVGVGTYNFVSAGLFIREKTVPIKDIMHDQSWNLLKLNWIDVNTIQLRTYAAADISVLSDDICDDTYINFKVYP